MGSSDYNISLNLNAGVTGVQDVKNLTINLKDLFDEAGSKGAAQVADGLKGIKDSAVETQKVLVSLGKTISDAFKPPAQGLTEEQRKAQEELKRTQAAAAALGKEFANTFKGDVAGGLKKGLTDSQAVVSKLTADLRAMYAAKVTGDPTGLLRTAIEQTEAKLQRANKELTRFQELSKSSGGPITPGGGADVGFSMGSLIGGLTLASLATKAIEASFNAVKEAISSVVSEGMKMNEFLEISKLGIATSVMAQYNMLDAQGKTLEGQEAYNAALAVSEEQMKAIRIAGLETAATSQQLVTNYQTAVGVGASQGISDLTKLRQLTIDVTNAATALGVSQMEVPTAIRAVITGREVEQNQLARILVGSGEQVRNWQMQGKLLDELNTRLKPFSEGAKQAAESWAVVKSNIEEAFQVFSGEVTSGLFTQLRDAAGETLKGIFDTKNLGISETFTNITKLIEDIFSGAGAVFVDMLKGAMNLAAQFNAFLGENKDTVEEWKQGFEEIWVAVKGVFTTIVDLGKAIFGVRKATGEISVFTTTISLTLKAVALLLAGIADGARVIGSAIIWVAGLLFDGVLQPIRAWLDNMGAALNLVKRGWGDGLLGISKKIDGVGASVRKVGADLFAPIANGDGAVKRVLKSFEDVGKAIDTTDKKAKNASTVGAPKNPQKKQIGMSAAQAVAKAEADVAVAAAKDALAREQRDLAYALSQQLVSIKDFYAKRQEAQLKNLQIDLAAKQKELAANDAAAPKSQDDQLTKRASHIKLQGEINILKLKEGDIILENTRKSVEANRALTTKVLEIRAQLEQAMNSSTADTMMSQITEKFRLTRQQFVTEFQEGSDQVKLVDRLIDVEKSKAQFSIIQNQYSQMLEAMKLKEQEIQQQEKEGTLGPIEAYTKLNELHKGTADQLALLIPQMQAYAAATNDPSMVASVQKLKLELAATAKAQSELGKSVGSGLTNNLTTFFTDLATGAKSGADAVKDFGRSVLATFAQIISQQLAMMAMRAMFQGTAMGGFMGFADGGAVSGPGTGTSDSIPAMLSNGEYVVKASAVSKVGTGFLDLLNGVVSRPMHGHFADGGPVTSNVGPAPSSGGSTKVVNVFDPSLVEGMLSVPRGVKAVLNIIENNPGYIRAILA